MYATHKWEITWCSWIMPKQTKMIEYRLLCDWNGEWVRLLGNVLVFKRYPISFDWILHWIRFCIYMESGMSSISINFELKTLLTVLFIRAHFNRSGVFRFGSSGALGGVGHLASSKVFRMLHIDSIISVWIYSNSLLPNKSLKMMKF